MTENLNIPAVHDDDLKKILIKYTLLDKFEAGQIKCYYCDNVMNWDNIYGLVYADNLPQLICDSIDCLEKLNNK